MRGGPEDEATVVNVDSRKEVPVGGSTLVNVADSFGCKEDGAESSVVLNSNKGSVSSRKNPVIKSSDIIDMEGDIVTPKDVNTENIGLTKKTKEREKSDITVNPRTGKNLEMIEDQKTQAGSGNRY